MNVPVTLFIEGIHPAVVAAAVMTRSFPDFVLVLPAGFGIGFHFEFTVFQTDPGPIVAPSRWTF